MKGKRKQDVADTKEAILAAADQVMREEGYAAVSSRRVAERAGSKSMSIHYHFGSMDDLFLALYRRSEAKYFTRLMRALSSDSPLRDLWELGQDPADTGLVVEYLALANHRNSVRDEVARSGERVREIATAIVANSVKDITFEMGPVSPAIVYFIIEALCRTLVSDRALGISSSHDEVVEFVERLLIQVEAAHRQGAGKRAQKSASQSGARSD